MASVRFICGAQTLHRALEPPIARHLGKDDAIVFAACFDANGGVFEPLMGEEDAIVSDSLNHASIIDGVRLSQGAPLPFRQFGHERTRGPAEAGRGGRRVVQADCDRRRVLDGRLCRELTRSASSPTPWRAFWSTTATRPAISATRAAARRRSSAARPRRHRHRHLGKTLGGGMGDFVAAAQPSSTSCASGRGPISSPTGSRRRSPPARSRRWRSRSRPTIAASAQSHARRFREGSRGGHCGPDRRDADHPGDARRSTARPGSGVRASTSAAVSMSPGSSSPSCRRAQARIRTQMSAALNAPGRRFRRSPPSPTQGESWGYS